MTETTDMKKFQIAGKTKTVQGSILNPENAGLCFVLNVANLAGKTDAPIYNVFQKKWGKVRQEARGWYTTKTGAYKAGAVQTVAVQSNVWVLNLLCQDEELKTDVAGLEKSLKEVCKMAKYENATVHVSSLLVDAVPEMIELLKKHVLTNGVSVYFYNKD